jgi:uncharacterized membrane protein YgdD (TMEM256/DUF423 family)
MFKPALKAGALFAMLAVILGAFGAHSLKQVLTENMLAVFETGVRYQFYHSFALLAAGILFSEYPSKQVSRAALFFTIGILLFCGSLYVMVVLSIFGYGLGIVGVITPIGGLFFILGWLFLFIGISKKGTTYGTH